MPPQLWLSQTILVQVRSHAIYYALSELDIPMSSTTLSHGKPATSHATIDRNSAEAEVQRCDLKRLI